MRKAVDGLNIIAREHRDDTQKNLYVFRNKNSNKVQCLFWDCSGYVSYYKRLEKWRSRFPSPKDSYMVLSILQLWG
jgi:transposase